MDQSHDTLEAVTKILMCAMSLVSCPPNSFLPAQRANLEVEALLGALVDRAMLLAAVSLHVLA